MSSLFLLILKTFYLLLPAYFANMAPVIFKKINFLNYPLDFNKKFKGKPILGRNKTFRGLFFGIVIGVLVSLLQSRLVQYNFFNGLSILDYSAWLITGFLLGFGAIVGDSIESFFKRRRDVGPGKSWMPFDQLDFIIGALICINLYQFVGWNTIIIALIISPFLHILVNFIAFKMRIRNEYK